MGFQTMSQLARQEIVLNIALCGDWAGNGWFRSHEARSTGFTHGSLALPEPG